MEIVEATKKHKEAIKDLLVELQQFVVLIDKFQLNILSPNYREGYFRKTWKECTNNGGKILFAVQEDKVVGMIAGHMRKYDKLDRLDFTCPKMGIIEELIVSKNFQKGGVGQKLIEAMEHFFKTQNCEFVKVGVFAYNKNAIKFYQKNSYEFRFHDMMKKL